jgi:hypothetical protein
MDGSPLFLSPKEHVYYTTHPTRRSELTRPPVLSQIKPQAPLLVVPISLSFSLATYPYWSPTLLPAHSIPSQDGNHEWDKEKDWTGEGGRGGGGTLHFTNIKPAICTGYFWYKRSVGRGTPNQYHCNFKNSIQSYLHIYVLPCCKQNCIDLFASGTAGLLTFDCCCLLSFLILHLF